MNSRPARARGRGGPPIHENRRRLHPGFDRRQGRSGLGLEAQRALARFAEAEGYDLAETFTEVETGKGADALDRRPQLNAALAAARRQGRGTPIVVAKLDRLSRDVHFISGLMAHTRRSSSPSWGRTSSRSCSTSSPRSPRKSALLISQRTRAALAAAKARGVKLGGLERPKASANREEARGRRRDRCGRCSSDWPGRSVEAIAAELNARGIATPKGGGGTAETVIRVQRRLGSACETLGTPQVALDDIAHNAPKLSEWRANRRFASHLEN